MLKKFIIVLVVLLSLHVFGRNNSIICYNKITGYRLLKSYAMDNHTFRLSKCSGGVDIYIYFLYSKLTDKFYLLSNIEANLKPSTERYVLLEKPLITEQSVDSFLKLSRIATELGIFGIKTIDRHNDFSDTLYIKEDHVYRPSYYQKNASIKNTFLVDYETEEPVLKISISDDRGVCLESYIFCYSAIKSIYEIQNKEYIRQYLIENENGLDYPFKSTIEDVDKEIFRKQCYDE